MELLTAEGHGVMSYKNDGRVLASQITSGASIIGCLFSFILTCVMKNHKEPLIKMILAISVLDIVFATSNLLLIEAMELKVDRLCTLASVLRALSYVGSLLWTAFFAHTLYSCLKQETTHIMKDLYSKYLWLSLGFFTLYSIWIILVVSFTDTDYSEVDSYNRTLFDLLWTSIPIVTVVLYNTICYLRVIRKIRTSGSTPLELLFYPSVLIICLLPVQFLVLCEYFVDNCYASLGVFSYASVFANLQGLLNAIVYGIAHIKLKHCTKLCCKPRKTNQIDKEKLLEIDNSSQFSLKF